MKRRNKKQTKKIRNLIFVCTLCAILLSVSTYAWFIGMKTVNVNPFEIKIATTEGLFLSMDGATWTYNLDVSDYIGADAYSGETNVWATDGLIPVSSVGDMDEDASRMKLYEKGSLTTTPGGYRLLASRVNNYNVDAEGNLEGEGNGYVAFDLFIKNLSGTEYYTDNDVRNEEDIFLTTNSAVTVTKVGSNTGIEGTGIENSVRVAFTQIGRAIATTGDDGDTEDIAALTGITCTSATVSDVEITGICRNATIWEPNDMAHEDNALSWYKTSCQRRITSTEQGEHFTYTGVKESCEDVGEEYAPTYAISRELVIEDYVDVYDGLKYNTYEENTIAYSDKDESGVEVGYLAGGSHKLVEFPYFRDTMKNIPGADRPTFMTLAPNSITKVRVYIYIEGQDIDNYDFASLGAYISVNFGFTKERYNGEDINYTGPTIPATNPTPELPTT